MVLSKLFFKDESPTPETLGETAWLYQDIKNTITLAVQNGTAKAFKGSE
jgi:hypothetical protein